MLHNFKLSHLLSEAGMQILVSKYKNWADNTVKPIEDTKKYYPHKKIQKGT